MKLQLTPETIVLAHVIEQGNLTTSTLEFLSKTLKHLKDNDTATCSELSALYGCTPQAGRTHVSKLTILGYLERVHYRAWSLSSSLVNIREQVKVKASSDYAENFHE